MKQMVLVATVALIFAEAVTGDVAAQGVDPTQVIQQLLRWQMEDMARRRAEDQQERIRKEQEAAYDRQLCREAGFRGPETERCMLAVRDYRQSAGAPELGTGVESRPARPGIECVTLDDGLGGGITDCF